MYTVVVHLSGVGRPNRFEFRRRQCDAARRLAEGVTRSGFWTRAIPATFIPPARVRLVELCRQPSKSARCMRGAGH
jgi:hypothetical protein